MRFWVFVFIVLSCTISYAEGLNTLIELGKNQVEIMKDYEAQTKIFKKIKGASAAGELKKGLTKDYIKKTYGEAVVNVKDVKSGRDKWVYMPASSSFFKGEKIHIYFTDGGLLDEVAFAQ